MREETADRLAAYSDAVFAVIVTIMVLELEARTAHSLRAAGYYSQQRISRRT